MLAEERFSEILKLVNEHKTITVQELTELLDMSESTIRRDLTTLHKKGKLIKVHRPWKFKQRYSLPSGNDGTDGDGSADCCNQTADCIRDRPDCSFGKIAG